MTNKLTRGIETSANVAILIVSILLCVVLVRTYLAPAPAPNPAGMPTEISEGVKRGDVVALTGIDWQKSGKTLLLALSTTCHFCTRSGPFYQRLAKEHGDARLVALVPQSSEEGRAYLKGLGVDVDDVRQTSLGELGVSGTPTLILVDGEGVASEVWVGALSPDKEEEVVSRFRAERASR